jgi:serine/threonine-protein kinase
MSSDDHLSTQDEAANAFQEPILDRFEAAWQDPKTREAHPRIEDYLEGGSRPYLLRELIVLDLAYRRKLGERPSLEEYQARFPRQNEPVLAAFGANPTERSPKAPPRTRARTTAEADRDLLFGVLAMQMDFISREALIAAVSAWVLDKSKPLDRVLVDQGVLASDERDLLEPLILKHLKRHGGDPERSLAAVLPAEPGQKPAEPGAAGDADADATLLKSSLNRIAGVKAWNKADRPDAVGTPTSSGLRFRILRLLARGGLGEVFIAHDEELHREVALKAIQRESATSADSRSRFLLEAEVTGRLEHPGIVPVYGLGLDADGRPFYAMRFIRGESLKEAIGRFHQDEPTCRSLAFRELLGRFVDVCDAIEYAHSRRVLHRDLKPANIMLGPYGETLVVDWGLAKVAGRVETGSASSTEEGTLRPASAGDSDATMPGAWIGTPAFMSPEQAEGRQDLLGPSTDVYSLGATLYHLLTGQLAFDDPDVFVTLRKVREGKFLRPGAINPRVATPALEAVCLKAMALRPDDRYPSARALADDLKHWLADEPVSAYSEYWPLQLARWSRRHRSIVVGAGALLVTAVVALSVSTVLIGRESSRREEQRQLAELNFIRARQAVDELLTDAAEVELADVPQMQAVRKSLLEKARGFYQGFLEQKRADPGIRREAGRAHIRLGEIAELLGDHIEADRAFRQGIAILEALQRDRPRWAEPRRDLSRGFDDLGMLLRKANRFGESETALRTALDLRKRLETESPDDPESRQDVSDSHYHLAVLMTKLRGRRLEDEASYREALRMRQELVEESRDQPAHRRKLARYLNNLALLLASTGRLREASDACHEAIAILEGFVSSGPSTPGDRWQLARTHGNLAMLLRTTGRLEDAEVACLKAEGLQKALRADFPDVPDYRHEHASILNNLGLLRKETNRLSEAETAFRDAIALQEMLVNEFSHRPDYRQSLAVTRLNLAMTLERSDPTHALRAYRDALAVQERLTAESPEVAEYQRGLGRTLFSLAQLLVVAGAGETGEARGHLSRAIGLHRAALDSNPRSDIDREFLRDDYSALCAVLIRDKTHDQAATVAEELPRLMPDDPRETVRAAAFLGQCATLAGPGRDGEAYAKKAVELIRAAVDRQVINRPDELRSKQLDLFRTRADFQDVVRTLEDRERNLSG